MLSAVQSGRYTKLIRFGFSLPSGEIKWTTEPYDNNGFESQNFILGAGNVVQGSGLDASSASIEIAGTLANYAAFNGCENSPVVVELAINDPGEWVTLFDGLVDQYQLESGISKNRIILELADFVSAKSGTNTYQLTPNDQARRYPGDTCLKYMQDSTEPTFWGAE